jgi:hypothetical protein
LWPPCKNDGILPTKSTTAAATSCPRFAALATASSPTAAVRSNCSRPPAGATEAIMRAHGFTVAQMVELMRDGLATATAERVVAGNKTIEIATVWITAAGRQIIGGDLHAGH